MRILSILLSFFISTSCLSQSKAELKKELAKLSEEKNSVSQRLQTEKQEKESLKKQLERIAPIEIDDVITPEEQPKDIKIGEGGWRVDLNGTKYKSDILGQLGTIWIIDTNNQLLPQGAILLSDYDIDPTIISKDNDILYKKFIAKGTSLQGDGGAPFAKITSGLKQDEFSDFSISIDGTSLIKPRYPDLEKIAVEVESAFKIPNSKGVFLCTGMHVIRYYSRIYTKKDGEGHIKSPVVNIGGNFYAESNEEMKEYFVARQLTQLFQPSHVNKDITKLISDIQTLINSKPTAAIQSSAQQYSPGEVLTFLLNRTPSNEEIIQFQTSQNDFLKYYQATNALSAKEFELIKGATKKLAEIPTFVKSQ